MPQSLQTSGSQNLTGKTKLSAYLQKSETKESLSRIIDTRTAIAERKNHLSVGAIREKYGHDAAVLFVAGQTTRISDVLGLKFSDAQLEDAIEEVMRIHWFTLADFKGLMEYCKTKKFFYRDYKEWLDYLKEYIDTSLNTAERDSDAEHQDRKAQELAWGERTGGIMTMADLYYEHKRKNQ